MTSARHKWTLEEVVDSVGPGAILRNYVEQRDVRACLLAAAVHGPIRRAADVGCGYGRLTPVLSEVASEVWGLEREALFVDEAKRLQPKAQFLQVESLERLPLPDNSVDFAMTFTVMQHMRKQNAIAVCIELKRIAQHGFVLVVEETDPTLADDDSDSGGGGVTIGRSVDTYREWMRPFELVLQRAREIEPGYPRPDVGTYMLFEAPGRSGGNA